MPKFLIEVAHDSDPVECALAIKVLLSSGSHFLTHADFGCLDEEHKAWIIVDVEDKTQARMIVPSVYRAQTKVVQLNKFSLEEIDEFLLHHKPQEQAGT